MKKRLSEDVELKQAFLHLLFNTAYTLINKPFAIRKALSRFEEEYLEEVDVVKQFLNDCFDNTGNDRDQIKANELYNMFKCRLKNAMGCREFNKSLERHGLVKVRTMDGTYVRAIKMKTINDNDNDHVLPNSKMCTCKFITSSVQYALILNI